MKNLRYMPLLLVMVLSFAACAITIPWDVMDEEGGVRVVMNVVPDDADVLLNGRFVGAAYEFASSRSALRLASRYNEIVLKKRGFHEKMVDLRDYHSRRISLRIELAPLEPGETGGAAAEPGKDPAYEAKSEPLPPQPGETPQAAPERFLTLVALTVAPEEAAIYIDGRFWGVSQGAGKPIQLRLPPGKHTITAFAPGFSAYSKEANVPRQDQFTIEITLQK